MALRNGSSTILHMALSLPQYAVVSSVKKHVLALWPESHLSVRKWPRGPVAELGPDFSVLELSPTQESNNLWVYCTAGTGDTEAEIQPNEFVLLASSRDERHVETLTMVAHYHRFESVLGLGHTVEIGHPWAQGSQCDRLLISLPYPFGPKLEWLKTPELAVRFLWALPITPQEARFAKQMGVEELERRFDIANLAYWDPLRRSIA